MPTHKTFFGRIFGTAWDSIKTFFSNTFANANHDLLEVAIVITNVVKNALSSNTAQFLVDLTKTNLDNEILAIANKNLAILLGDEILLQGVKDATTTDEIQAVFQKVLDSFGTMTDSQKEKLYTSLAADVYKLYLEVKSGQKITFGEAALLVESAYQEWLSTQQK